MQKYKPCHMQRESQGIARDPEVELFQAPNSHRLWCQAEKSREVLLKSLKWRRRLRIKAS